MCVCPPQRRQDQALSHYDIVVPLCPDVYQYLCPPAIQRVLEDEKLFPPLGKNQTSAFRLRHSRL